MENSMAVQKKKKKRNLIAIWFCNPAVGLYSKQMKPTF